MSKISCASAAMSLLLACDYQDPSLWLSPEIESFEATKVMVSPGMSTMLTAKFFGVWARVEPGPIAIRSDTPIEVKPLVSTCYRLYVMGGQLQDEEEASVWVEVVRPGVEEAAHAPHIMRAQCVNE